MLTFYGVGKAKEEKISLFKKGAIPFLKEVGKEEGVLDFKLFQQKDDPTWFLFYEVYQDEEAFEKHRKSQHVDDYYEILMECIEQETVKGFWEEVGSIKR